MEAEEMHHLMCTSWPRLYLDTGDLLDIADGRADQSVTNDLMDVVAERGVILVVSMAHFQDVLSVDGESRDRLSAALERFRFRAVVMAGPAEIELGPTKTADIVLSMAGNIRELVNASVGAESLASLAFLQGKLHEAFVSNQVARASERRPVSKQAYLLGLQCLISLVRAWPSEDTEAALEYWAAKDNVELASWERDTLLAQLRPMERLLREVQTRWPLSESRRGMLIDAWKATVDPSAEGGTPGQFLSGTLTGSQMRNVTRNPRSSDFVDTSHIAHLPYVDVATSDRASFAAVAQQLTRVQGPRSVQLLRNHNLQHVLAAVSSLPNAVDELMAMALASQ